MKYLEIAVLGALIQGGAAVATGCVSGKFTLDVKGNCNHTALLTSFTKWFEDPVNVAAGCTGTAEEELSLLLNATSTVEATAAVHGLCRSAFENYGDIPFETSTGKDARFVEEYFKGKSDWNEQVQTESVANKKKSMILKYDARAVDQFHDGDGKHHILGMPDLPNFDSCAMNAAYCCWPKDRQDDNDGNCDKPYDRNCVDANPGDNTDLCFVDQADGAKSTGYNTTEGWFTFPFDDGNNNFKAEGPIHCHGFAWADDQNDPSYVYRGNNLFFVSLFDHMYTRGYVKSIAGAPMCGCAEQMPTVSRSDCTQIDFENQEHDFVFTFNAGGVVTAELDTLYIDFNACQGLDRDFDADNNDLWSYMNRLYVDDKISGDKLRMLSQKLVGDNNCQVGEQKGLAKNGLIRGHDDMDDTWVFLDGRDALGGDTYYGKAAFQHLVGSSGDNNSSLPILRRGCASCHFDQQWLYYKRVTAAPDNLWWQIRFGRKKVTGHEYGTDFLIYSSYEDAQNDENAWTCPKYNYGRGFPGDCGPNGTTRSNQHSIFREDYGISSGANDVAWFAENRGKELRAISRDSAAPRSAGPFGGLATTLIGMNDIPGDAYMDDSEQALYVSASGKDIWSNSDSMRFTYEDSSDGDLTVSVKVSSIDYRESWTKAGLMVRDSLKADAKHFSVILSGKNDVATIWRPQDGGRSSASGHSRNVEHESIWLKLTKRGDTFRGFKSLDGETWDMVSTARDIVMNSTDLKVGLAVTSHHTRKLTELKFESYLNENYQFPSSAPSATPAPSHGHPDERDIGGFSSSKPGQVIVQGDKTIVKTTGRGIWSSRDGFTFINQQVTGDFNMTVRVNSPETTPSSWTKMGIMVRDSLAENAKHISLLLVPQKGIIRHVRKATGGSTTNMRYNRKMQDTVWLRIQREGNNFTCWESMVGNPDDSEWHMVQKDEVFDSSVISFDNPAALEVGIAMTSSSWNNYATAEFEHFSVQEAPVPTTRRLRGSEP